MDGWTNGTLIDAFAQAQLNFQLHYIRLLWEQSSPAVKSSGLIYPRSCKGFIDILFSGSAEAENNPLL